jgi:hypothetical protein
MNFDTIIYCQHGPTGLSAASPHVRTYRGGHCATTGLDDVLAQKHVAAPQFKVVALLLAWARRTMRLRSAAGSPWPPPLGIFRRPPPKPPNHYGALPSFHSTPLVRVSSRPRRPFAGAPAPAATAAGRRRAPLAGTLHPQPSPQTGCRWVPSHPPHLPRPTLQPESPDFGRNRRPHGLGTQLHSFLSA